MPKCRVTPRNRAVNYGSLLVVGDDTDTDTERTSKILCNEFYALCTNQRQLTNAMDGSDSEYDSLFETVLSSEMLQELDIAEKRFNSRLVSISGAYYGVLMTCTNLGIYTSR
jgi:hypothetical protein